MTPIEKIKGWIEDKPIWWKHTIRLALVNGELDQDDINEIYQIARIEHYLEDEQQFDRSRLDVALDFSGYTTEVDKVNLASIENVQGVGVLHDEQILKFNESGCFIVYGDNGAGKSSYASILKNACLTRGSCPTILGNVFSVNNPTPSANIRITVGGKDEIHAWSLNKDIIPSLKAIRVFDSTSAQHYVNKEDSLGFKPSGLNLLTELTKTINRIKAFIDEDTMAGNGFIKINPLESNSVTAQFFNDISYKTNEADVLNHVASKEEILRIEPLLQEISKFKLQTPESIKASLRQQIDILTPLYQSTTNILRHLGDKAFERLVELQDDYHKKQKIADDIMQATLQGLPLDTIAGIAWQTMWTAAKNFIKSEPKAHNFPPIQGDSCPLCLQDISEVSAERLASLSTFLANSAATDAKDAHNLLKNALLMISSQDVSLTNHNAALTEIDKLQPGMADKITVLFNTLSERQKLFTTSSSYPASDSPLDTSATTGLYTAINIIAEQLSSINDNNDLSKLIIKKESELNEIKDRKYIQENLEHILNNIRRHKVIEKMNKIRSECDTRGISLLSSKIYQQDVIEPLKNSFQNELKSFGFTRFSVDVQTRNSGGYQQFKLSIAESGEQIVAKVASEGEQRCIAIAAFLAEMKVDNRQSTVIFDDPVNSLSHQWSCKIAKRLIDESINRQVIIFTHDIVFFKILLEQVEIQQAKYGSLTLERSRKHAGIVRDSAPWEALTTSKRLNYLNTKLQNLRKIDKDGTENDFHRASREFYGLLRESWERLIEEKLLNKVVCRFERGVSTQRLSRLIDISESDIQLIDNAMSKCSAYFTGHDNAPAVGAPCPTIDEVEADLSQIKSYLSDLQVLRKRT